MRVVCCYRINFRSEACPGHFILGQGNLGQVVNALIHKAVTVMEPAMVCSLFLAAAGRLWHHVRSGIQNHGALVVWQYVYRRPNITFLHATSRPRGPCRLNLVEKGCLIRTVFDTAFVSIDRGCCEWLIRSILSCRGIRGRIRSLLKTTTIRKSYLRASNLLPRPARVLLAPLLVVVVEPGRARSCRALLFSARTRVLGGLILNLLARGERMREQFALLTIPAASAGNGLRRASIFRRLVA